MTDELGSLHPASARATRKQEVGTGRGQDALDVTDQVQDFIDQMDVHGFVLTFVGTHGLVDHGMEVGLADSSKRRKSRNQTLLSLNNLADKERVLQLLTEAKVRLQQRIQDLVEPHLAVNVDEAVLEDTAAFVDQSFDQALGFVDFITKQAVNQTSDVSGSEEVMTVVINRELLLHVAVEVDEELSKLLRAVGHCSLGKLRVRKNSLQELSIDRSQLVVGRVLHVANADVGSEPS
mmetsp:Transcript_23934/g.36621  ORF Transcript_23934/g.36621 Transcript_23934/m.36621 type:complete len:235 (-) Transcript_23934:7252-7956(-)